MYQCPICRRNDFPTIKSRDEHLFIAHPQNQQGSGWFEGKKETPDGAKAIEHMIAAEKAKMSGQNRPMSIPLPPPPKQEFQPISGWTKAPDNTFLFERLIYRHNTPYNAIDYVMRGKITPNRGIIILHRFDKEISEMTNLQQKAVTLNARMQALTTSDDAFMEIAKEINAVNKRITELAKTTVPEETTELILEEYWNNEYNTTEHDNWRKQFMDQTISECDRLSKSLKHSEVPYEIPEKNMVNKLVDKIKPS